MDDKLRAEILSKGILDYIHGDYDRPGIKRKIDQCPHGLFRWDACENCIDEHFQRVLEEAGYRDGNLPTR